MYNTLSNTVMLAVYELAYVLVVSSTSIKLIWTALGNPNKRKPKEEFVYGLEATLSLDISSRNLLWYYDLITQLLFK